ncbi:restriction endonuclease subunit S [Propionibacterium freudenreichii]|uniref:restriction endonuclease subunit S n=1 Tax=Propionibacterium freudenreichii TaxID=1744 RepID=UPI0009BDEBE0|nr:restriction endonuclease subunit S [Propionibacterium freudenreichii]
MSQIEEVIERLCPDGVRAIPLGEIVKNLDSKRRPVTRGNRRNGPFPYYGANGIQDYVHDYLFDGTFLLLGEDGSVIRPNGSPVLNWATGKIWVNNHAHVLQPASHSVDLRFLYYFLTTVKIGSFITGGTQPKLNQRNMNGIPVMVPPLEVQHEIVKILDTFTDLEAELEAELESRRQQYAYYEEELVSRSQIGPTYRLSELESQGIISLGRGKVISKKTIAALPGDYPVYSSSGAGSGEFGRYGDYLFSGERIIWSIDGGGRFFYRPPHRYSVTNVSGWMTVDNDIIRTRYLYYVLTAAWRHEKFDYTRKAHPSVIRDLYHISVPPLSDQDRLVRRLDTFDALVNDLNSGLPAELNARRQQYEYYRDKLLTFKELKS